MPKPAKFTEAHILSAAARLVAADGPGAATVAAIGAALGAPSGSIYHRFASRDALLGRLWLDKAAYFQDAFAAAIAAHADPVAAGRAAALSLPRAARADLTAARIMLLYRREDFLLSGAFPDDMRAEAERLGQQIRQGLADLTRRLFGRATADARRTTTFAVLDVPYAAIRRYLAAGEAPPARVDELVRVAYDAVVGAALAALAARTEDDA